jgi:hypothetical protein
MVGSLGFLVTPALMVGPADMMLANFITFWAKDAPNCRSPRRVAERDLGEIYAQGTGVPKDLEPMRGSPSHHDLSWRSQAVAGRCVLKSTRFKDASGNRSMMHHPQRRGKSTLRAL